MTLGRAVSLSTAVHAIGCALLLFLCAGDSGRELLPLDLEVLANEPLLDVEMVQVSEPDVPDPPPPREGDGTQSAQRDEAPSRFSGRELARVAPASGTGPGVHERLEWTGRRDDQTIHTQLQNATAGYQPQRVRTAARGISLEPDRMTPRPGIDSAQAARDGNGEGRIQGVVGGAGPGSPLPDGEGVHPGEGTRLAKDGDAEVGSARPFLPEGPELMVAPRQGSGAADDADSRLRSADPHPHALAGLELGRAASPGSGETSGGPAQKPGFSRSVEPGRASMPAGDPQAPEGDGLWLRTTDRRYLPYFQAVYERVRSQWVYPRALARQLLQGQVVVSFTIRKDGRVADIALRKSSGFREFDENVIHAVERAAPLPPVPAALGGKDLRVNAPFEYLNPLVR